MKKRGRKKNLYSWDEAGKEFVENRIIEVPVKLFKECSNASQLPYEPDDKEMVFIDNVIGDQARTLLYSYEKIMEKFGYIEKVGDIKYNNEQEAKDYCFGLIKSQATWNTAFSLVGVDNGCVGVPVDRFPFEPDDFEVNFWENGVIDAYLLHIDDLQNGMVLSREIVWDALRAVFERNLAILRWKLARCVIKNRIKGL